MMQGNIADAWLNLAFGHWMFACGCQSHMREPTAQLVERMHEAVRNENHAAALNYINSLRDLAGRFSHIQTGSLKIHTYETAETRVECARAAYVMGDKTEAIQLLMDASTKYTGHDHWRAVVLWMLGCIQWQLPTRVNEAIFSWETACEIFRTLEGRSDRVEHAKWYAYWCEKMRVTLDRAVDGIFESPPPKSEWPKFSENSNPVGYGSAQGAEAKPDFTAGENPGDRAGADALRAFFIYESIPAGGFERSPRPQSRIEIDRIFIGQKPYCVENLREGQIVNLIDKEDYVVVKVTGDSMNLRNIVEGDYVLLHVQRNASHGDIVAVEIDNHLPGDEKATLKQLIHKDGKIVLRPLSDNPNNPTYEFTEKDRDFHICGVAIAVLKQIK